MEPTKTSEALKIVVEEVCKLSGYSENTVQNSYLAFAYGLVVGATMAMVKDFEEREAEFERKRRAGKQP